MMLRCKLSIAFMIIATAVTNVIITVDTYRHSLSNRNPSIRYGLYATRKKAANNLNKAKRNRKKDKNNEGDTMVATCTGELGEGNTSQNMLASSNTLQEETDSTDNDVTFSKDVSSDQHSLKQPDSSYDDSDSRNVHDIVEVDVPVVGEQYVPGRKPSIHERLLEGREFQLHIPPIANFKPRMRKEFTKPDTYAQLTADYTQNTEHDGDYVDGPLNVYDMVKQGSIPDFRHSADGKHQEPGESDLFTWKVERPPDVFIINWSGVAHLGYRDGVVVAAKALLNMTEGHPREIHEMLQNIAQDGKLPIWLSTRARYAQPFIEKASDWIPALYYFINNCNGQNMADQDKRIQALADTKAEPIDILKHITNGGDPNRLVDMGKKQRDDMGIEPFELEGWKTDSSRYSNMMSTYDQILKKIGVQEETIEHDFHRTWWSKLSDDHKAWMDILLYRTKCDHLDETQRQNHEAFNCAVVNAIKHHLEVFKVPVYLISDLKTTSIIKKEMEALDVHPLDGAHVYGRECGSVEEIIRDLLSKLDLDRRVPVHYIDDRLINLEKVNKHDGLEHVRTYFVDWGRSTYNEKLGALYSDSVKYVKSSSWLVRFMATTSTYPGREWTHGFRLRRPDEEVAKSVMDWKKRWHKLPEITEVPQRPMLKVS